MDKEDGGGQESLLVETHERWVTQSLQRRSTGYIYLIDCNCMRKPSEEITDTRKQN